MNFPKLKDLKIGDVIYVEALWGNLGDSYWRRSRAVVTNRSGGRDMNITLRYLDHPWKNGGDVCHIDKIEGRRLSKLDKILD